MQSLPVGAGGSEAAHSQHEFARKSGGAVTSIILDHSEPSPPPLPHLGILSSATYEYIPVSAASLELPV